MQQKVCNKMAKWWMSKELIEPQNGKIWGEMQKLTQIDTKIAT